MGFISDDIHRWEALRHVANSNTHQVHDVENMKPERVAETKQTTEIFSVEKRAEILQDWQTNHASCQSFRKDGTFLREAVERVWHLIEREKVAGYDRHALLTLLTHLHPQPDQVRDGAGFDVEGRLKEYYVWLCTKLPPTEIPDFFTICKQWVEQKSETATLKAHLNRLGVTILPDGSCEYKPKVLREIVGTDMAADYNTLKARLVEARVVIEHYSAHEAWMKAYHPEIEMSEDHAEKYLKSEAENGK